MMVRSSTKPTTCSMPGSALCPETVRNLRRVALLETHAADLSFLFGIDQGEAGSPLLPAPLATFETPHHTPFAYHLHVQDVTTRARRHRQRQELPPELHGHERAAV